MQRESAQNTHSEIVEWLIEFGPVTPTARGDGCDATIDVEVFQGTEEEAKKRGQFLCDEYIKTLPKRDKY